MKDIALFSILSFLIGVICTFVIMSAKLNKLRKEEEETKLELQQAKTLLSSNPTVDEGFQKIAQEIMNKTSEELSEKNESLLSPLKEELKNFKEKVEELKTKGVENHAALRARIDTLREDSLALKSQTQSLTDSLKLNSKSRGIFGELVLEQILTSSGLINKNEDKILGNYITQTGFKDNLSPAERARVPDVIVFYPEDQKHIVIDSKCPLNHFQEFMSETDEDKKAESLNEFYSVINDMVNSLSEKYNSLEGLSTPEFKVLFVPMETAYLYIYERPDLIDAASRKNVVIAGPANMVAMLKIIKDGWDSKKISDNMTNLQQRGNSLYENFCIFIGKLESLEEKFAALNKAFEEAFKTIRGQRGLIKQFDKFKQMGLNPNKQIPDKYLNENFEESEETEEV